jgi:Sec-independent protein translocase protein TatA
MFGTGFFELGLLALLALFFFGVNRRPKNAREAGRVFGIWRRLKGDSRRLFMFLFKRL